MNSKGKEMPHGVRLYSIGSSRYGDFFDGKTTSLCVRRALYTDPETGKEDPAKKGICSNFLCDAKPGQLINMTGARMEGACSRRGPSQQGSRGQAAQRARAGLGRHIGPRSAHPRTHACTPPPRAAGPTGKVLLLPPEQNAVLICVATGTGIAPYRSFWRRCFYENVPNYKFSGLFWLFMGVANSDSKLYDNELQEIAVRGGQGGAMQDEGGACGAGGGPTPHCIGHHTMLAPTLAAS